MIYPHHLRFVFQVHDFYSFLYFQNWQVGKRGIDEYFDYWTKVEMDCRLKLILFDWKNDLLVIRKLLMLEVEESLYDHFSIN